MSKELEAELRKLGIQGVGITVVGIHFGAPSAAMLLCIEICAEHLGESYHRHKNRPLFVFQSMLYGAGLWILGHAIWN